MGTEFFSFEKRKINKLYYFIDNSGDSFYPGTNSEGHKRRKEVRGG